MHCCLSPPFQSLRTFPLLRLSAWYWVPFPRNPQTPHQGHRQREIFATSQRLRNCNKSRKIRLSHRRHRAGKRAMPLIVRVYNPFLDKTDRILKAKIDWQIKKRPCESVDRVWACVNRRPHWKMLLKFTNLLHQQDLGPVARFQANQRF